MDAGEPPLPIKTNVQHIQRVERKAIVNKVSDSEVKISNHGQIDQMAFPKGWVASEPEPNPGIGSRSFREVHPADAPDATMCFFYRGLPVNDEAAMNFSSILSQPPHELAADEVEKVREILRMKTPTNSDQFSMSSAATTELNGKKVLVVEGKYADSTDQIHEVYVDADGSGRFVQEIYFQAPKEQYDKHWKAARAALDSIAWK